MFSALFFVLINHYPTGHKLDFRKGVYVCCSHLYLLWPQWDISHGDKERDNNESDDIFHN